MTRKKHLLGKIETVLCALLLSSLTYAAEPVLNEEGFYEISSEEDLAWFRDQVNAGNTEINAALTGNIKLMTVCGEGIGNWLPIASVEAKYNGTFDGNDYRISDLYIDEPEKDNQAFFAAIGENGVVKNLALESRLIKGDIGVGAISALCEGTIIDCQSLGREIFGTSNVGTIAGTLQNGTLSRCLSNTVKCLVGRESKVGGLVGYNVNGKISNCGAITEGITCQIKLAGGLVGENIDGTISYCHTLVTLSTNTAGIAGMSNTNKINHCAYFNGQYPYNEDYKIEEILLQPVGVVYYEGEVDAKSFDAMQFLSGEVAFYLNKGQENGPWKQLLNQEYDMEAPYPLNMFEELTVYEYEVCNGKIKKYTNDPDQKSDGHRVEYQEAFEATCSETGQKEHWECTYCHSKFVATNCATSVLDRENGIITEIKPEDKECVIEVSDEDVTIPLVEHIFSGEGKDVKCNSCPIHRIQSLPDQLNTICRAERGVVIPCNEEGEINVYSVDCVRDNILYANEESNELEAAVPYLYTTNGENYIYFLPAVIKNETVATRAINANGLSGVLIEDCDDNGETGKNYKTVIGSNYAIFTSNGIKLANATSGNKININRAYLFLPDAMSEKPQPSPMARPIAQLDSDITSVTDVEIEATDADAELYDLTGRSVDASSVRNSFVIKKQGNKVTKSFQK